MLFSIVRLLALVTFCALLAITGCMEGAALLGTDTLQSRLLILGGICLGSAMVLHQELIELRDNRAAHGS